MKVKWFKDLPKHEEQDLKDLYKANARFREKLAKILITELASIQTQLISREDLSKDNWQLIQLEKIGRANALKDLIGMITDKD